MDNKESKPLGNVRIIRDRKQRLERIEKERIDKLCPGCRRVVKKENGKWVRKEKKTCPARKNNNKDYRDFLKNLRKQDEYKDIHYLEFVSIGSKLYREQKEKK